MKKFIVFNNRKIDTGLFLQLQDLASVLTGIPDLAFKFDFGHYLDAESRILTASHFWDNLPQAEMEAGYKTDVYLRAIGTFHHTNENELQSYLSALQDVAIKKFASQLFTLLEDLRLEELCKRERPGTAKWFRLRKLEYHKYFESQLKVNASRGYHLDELFSMIYLTLQGDVPDPAFAHGNERQIKQLEGIKPILYEAFEARTTREVSRIAEQAVFRLAHSYEDDCLNEYFVFPVRYSHSTQAGLTLADLKRKSKLKNEDSNSHSHESEEGKTDKLPTWHRETNDGEQSRAFLQFDLESGTKTRILGDSVRQTEDGGQAAGSMQGKSRSSANKDYEGRDDLETQEDQPKAEGLLPYGSENKDAVLITKHAHSPSQNDVVLYRAFLAEVEGHIRKLSRTIEKTLEHKKNNPRNDLAFGRLSKKLLPLVLDDLPRIFYKKNQESKEVDAVFTLLVDCSASMHDKMDETKKGIMLFHEVLKALSIPHSIVGFWEDANQVKKGYQPNYYHVIKDFGQSISGKSGAEIMQLAPQEDNRDGFSIRHAVQLLEKRWEKNKFLLVFSDGEPAADDYDQNGIVDTKEAVLLARRKGIEVIGMFLSNGAISEEDEKTMQNIYDKEHLLIPSIEDLPNQFAPLLKKLLLKSI